MLVMAIFAGYLALVLPDQLLNLFIAFFTISSDNRLDDRAARSPDRGNFWKARSALRDLHQCTVLSVELSVGDRFDPGIEERH